MYKVRGHARTTEEEPDQDPPVEADENDNILPAPEAVDTGRKARKHRPVSSRLNFPIFPSNSIEYKLCMFICLKTKLWAVAIIGMA